jgi:oligopeptide transport system substrate-binding protein
MVDSFVTYMWQTPPPPLSRRRVGIAIVAALLSCVLVSAVTLGMSSSPGLPGWPGGPGASSGALQILGPSASSFDPAVQSDAGSAQVVSQLFESLTAVDANGRVQPALAESWRAQNDGMTIAFKLRSGLQFSNGDPLVADDVVSSWMRVLDPARPSQLASLLDGVVGARAYREGSGAKSAVGIKAVGDDEVQVDLTHPASDFAAIASSPTLAVVPPNIDSRPAVLRPGSFVGSGAYTLSAETDTETTLLANGLYWAGAPAIRTIHLLHTIGGKSPVSEFEAGNLDYTPISMWDAMWVAYDKDLGPSLRSEPSPSVDYYGFNTTKAPFDNVHVRRAFRLGIDWRRIVDLLGNPLQSPATSLVPPDAPGRSNTDFGAQFDLAQAKAELAAAGYPNGVGFPKITLVTAGADLDASIIAQLRDNLGIQIGYETLDGDLYFDRILQDPPDMWQMGWVADYPGANDFLGILLGTGVTYNIGRWSNADFDAAIEEALAAPDAASAEKGFDKAQAIIVDQVPVIPVDYGGGYALAAPGLLGAYPNAQGLVRYAGLAWAPNS